MFSDEQAQRDPIAAKLKLFAQNILVVVFGLLPLFFIPSSSVPFEYAKIFLALGGILFALILYSLSVLRSGIISIGFSYALGLLWVVVLVTFLSTLLSGDFRDALVGDVMSIHSAVFVTILALTATIWTLLNVSKTSIMRLYVLLAVSTLVLVIFHVVRLIFGAEVLSLGIFVNSVSSPIGGWNDLALFLGLTVLLSLVAIEQLPLTKSGRILFGVVTVLALGMLAVINFFAVWLILGITSLAILVYTLGRGRLGIAEATSANMVPHTHSNIASLVLSLVVFITSVLFIIGGSALGGFVSGFTDVSYIEVRPSFEATTDIARGVYGENAFVGVGPNKFADAWRLYKDQAINATIFWNTDFNAGSGYVPTFFITTGVLGGLAWIAFLALFLVQGIRFLIKAPSSDRMWYFIGVSSFVSAVYVWSLSIVYVPGAVILLIGALFTGVTFVAQNAMQPERVRTFSVGANKRTGFIFTLLVIAIIIGSVSALYTTGRHFAAAYTFNESISSVQAGVNLDEIEAKIVAAYQLSASDLYARRVAEYQFARMNSLLTVSNPTEEQQQQFQSVLANAINAGQQAVAADQTEPQNHAVLGSIYSVLVSANIEGSYDRATDELTRARDLDPKNPIRYLALAELEARAGNFESSRAFVEEAIRLKQNYSNAFFFLSQLDIATGNVEGAIDASRAIISLEPQNPARYYQLGVLESARGNNEVAVLAFERAVELDKNYANALYFLALGYDALGRSEEAKAGLERVLELNPDSEEVQALINTININGSLGQGGPQEQSGQLTTDEVSVTEDNGTVTTTEPPNSTLVTPVNTAPAEEEEEEETNDPEPPIDDNEDRNQSDESVVEEGTE